MMRKVLFVAALLAAVAITAEAQATNAAARGSTCTVAIQYDNDPNEVAKGKAQEKILQVLADKVFLLAPGGSVKQISAINQGGVVRSQTVITYSATGATTNGKSPCANCEAATKRQTLGLQNSMLESSIQKATDTWIPNDKADVQKATCQAS